MGTNSVGEITISNLVISKCPNIRQIIQPFLHWLILNLCCSEMSPQMLNIRGTLLPFSSVQFSRSVLSDSLRPHKSQHARPPCHHQLLEFTQTHVHRVSDAIQPSHPLLSPSPPSIRVFPNESTLRMKWPKYQSFSISISPSNEHPGLIFFRMDWLDLLAVQRTLKGLLHHHSSKASILWRSAFFTVQLSHDH